MGNPVYIYLLCDPITREPKYVGSAENVRKRLTQHIQESQKGGPRAKDEWIKSLADRGLLPTVWILETTDEGNRRDREDHWHVEYMQGGAALVNPNTAERNGAISLKECPRCRRLLRALRRAVTVLTTDDGKAVGNRPVKDPNHWTRRKKNPDDLLAD